MKINNYKSILEEKGIRPSHQRIEILKYLDGNKNHPSAEEIYKDLYKKIPTLSLTTVYNTMKIFSERGIVNVLNIDNNETRFDPDTKNHVHFICIKCGRVYDIDNVNLSNKKTINGHKITQTHIYYKGICKKCTS